VDRFDLVRLVSFRRFIFVTHKLFQFTVSPSTFLNSFNPANFTFERFAANLRKSVFFIEQTELQIALIQKLHRVFRYELEKLMQLESVLVVTVLIVSA
jgi:hypothetical protein